MTTNMKKQGLYNPDNEHDSCGIGFVANLKNVKSHHIVQQGLKILCNVTHRGAVGADPLVGDGVGVLIQIPDNFFREILTFLSTPEIRQRHTGTVSFSSVQVSRLFEIMSFYELDSWRKLNLSAVSLITR